MANDTRNDIFSLMLLVIRFLIAQFTHRRKEVYLVKVEASNLQNERKRRPVQYYTKLMISHFSQIISIKMKAPK